MNNGGFEVPKSNNLQKAKYWDAIDTTKFVGLMYSAIIPPYLIPISGITFQWPRSGNAWFGTTLFYKPNTTQTLRGYPRNILKGTLQVGKTYCIKFYCNITNQSSYGVDGLGAYFGDNTTDTISHCMTPISYLTPQIQNPTNNIISDTLNWILISGTFVANGTEKYMILGNFKSDAATNSVMINPANLPVIATDVLYDDVSVIDIDLPAYAGPDIWGIPFNTVYLGRPQDVGIDEACMWYKLPNTTTAIDTAAGINVTVGVTIDAYVVRQEICGNVKWDTVIVYPSATGLSELEYFKNNISVFPNPASDFLNINLNFDLGITFSKIEIINNLGQIIREEEINFKNKTATIKTDALENGVYFLKLSSRGTRDLKTDPSYRQDDNNLNFSKRFVIAR